MSVSYREDFKLYWPDWDTKAVQNFEYIKQNLNTMDYAISKCQKLDLCIQAGGHAGMWPIRLGQHFKEVITFEPDPDLFECMKKNILVRNVFPVNYALGESISRTYLKRSGSSGTNRINPLDGFPVGVIDIDSMFLSVCDAIFLDVEHYEFQALKGAEDTIKKFRPVIQVEELKSSDNKVQLLLESWGYKKDKKFKNDRVYLP